MGNIKEQEHLPPPNKIGARHVQVFLLFLGMAIAYALRVCMSVAIPAMVIEKGKEPTSANPSVSIFDWDASTTSYILSSFFWGYSISQLPSGHLANIHSAQKMLAVGMGISSLLSMLIPFLADYGYLPVIICRVVTGFAQGCLLPCVQTLLSRWVPPLERARLGSFVMNGPQFGTVVTMPICGALAASWMGWPSIFYIFGAIGVVWGVLFYCFGSDRPSDHPRICPTEAGYINSSLGNLDKAGLKPKVPWREILTSLPMWAIVIAHCGHNWGFYTLLTKLPSYMKSALNFDISQSGSLSAVPYLAMWLLGFPLSYISDLAVRKGAPLVVVRKISNSIGLWIPAVAMIVLCVVTTTEKAVLVGILVVAVGFNSGVMCGFQINHIDLSPRYAGIMMSITNGAANLAGIIAPLVVGAIVPAESDLQRWHIVFYITAAIYIVTNLAFVIFGQASLQPWNNYGLDSDQTRQTKRMSVISMGGEPTSVCVPEEIKEEEEQEYRTPC